MQFGFPRVRRIVTWSSEISHPAAAVIADYRQVDDTDATGIARWKKIWQKNKTGKKIKGGSSRGFWSRMKHRSNTDGESTDGRRQTTNKAKKSRAEKYGSGQVGGSLKPVSPWPSI